MKFKKKKKIRIIVVCMLEFRGGEPMGHVPQLFVIAENYKRFIITALGQQVER